MSIRFYTQEQLGPTQALTNEGFLLCQNVPLARTGTLLYAEGEIPLEAGPNKIIRVQREPEDVFNPIAIASFAGKPITDDHPPEKVTPDNWKQYAIGVALNPRRGDGVKFDNDFLYADLLIHDANAIEAVRDGKREVSAGYDADYEQLAPGEGRQHQIIGNHVALVDKGRCGPRCAIGDHQMTATRRPAWMDRVMKAHRTGDEGALVSELGKVGEMLGDVVSDAEMPPPAAAAPASAEPAHHITVNVGGHAPARDESDPAPGTPPGAAPADAGGNGEVMQALQQIMQRLDACEQAIAMLAQGDDDDTVTPTPAADPAATDPEADPAPEDTSTDPKPDAPPKKNDDDAMPNVSEDRRAGSKDVTAGYGPTPPAIGKGKAATGDARAATADSKPLRSVFNDMLSRGEILAPGVKLPTFDAASNPRATFDAMCAFRRNVLAAAWKTPEGNKAIEPLLGGARPNFSGMTCDAASLLFNGASELIRQANNHSIGNVRNPVSKGPSETPSARSLNERNRQHYGIK